MRYFTMALMRNNIRLWIRSTRLFSAEPPILTLEVMKLLKGSTLVIPTTLLQKSNFVLNEWLRTDKSISQDGWVTVRNDLMSSTEFKITEATIDMTIVHLCLHSNKMNLAMLYLQYLWDNGYDMNISTMATYLKCCFIKKEQDILQSEKDYLLKMYDAIRVKYPVLDTTTAENCIKGITKTERWKESLELLEMAKIFDKPRPGAYMAIICTAFQNNDPEIGWKYLREAITRLNPDNSGYITYLDYCTRNFKGAKLETEIAKMVEFWGDHDIRPYVDVILAYEKVLCNLGWSTLHTSIRKVGSCRGCDRKLATLNLTEEQFARMAQFVRERIIVGDDVYKKSSPKELKTFLEFVERTRPYDIVIDGLNVSYLAKAKVKPDGSQVNKLFKMCISMGKKVLILGRKHMLRWPKLDYNFMRLNGHIFLADDMTADDPYVLFATLRSGPHTQFISKDLMRQHKFVFQDPELLKIFKYWQMSHQLTPLSFKTDQGQQIGLSNPPLYLPVAQKNDGGFHVPYNIDGSILPPLTYNPPSSWVCFQKTNRSTHKK